MPPPTIPFKDLSAAVQNAVQKVLDQHGAHGIDHLWVGFVAPDALATMANAQKIAHQLGVGGEGLGVQPSIAQLAPAAGGAGAEKAPTLPKGGHIIGLIYKPK